MFNQPAKIHQLRKEKHSILAFSHLLRCLHLCMCWLDTLADLVNFLTLTSSFAFPLRGQSHTILYLLPNNPHKFSPSVPLKFHTFTFIPSSISTRCPKIPPIKIMKVSCPLWLILPAKIHSFFCPSLFFSSSLMGGAQTGAKMYLYFASMNHTPSK